MAAASPDPLQDPATSVPSGAVVRFIEELRHSTAPLAQCTDTAMAFTDGGRPQWLTRQAECACSHHLTIQSSCLAGNRMSSRHCEIIQVGSEERPFGRVIICHGGGQPPVLAAVRQLVHAVVRHVELVHENESLLAELGASWESLEAVYELSSDVRLLQDPADLLDRITGKAVSIHEGLRAILWREDQGRLVPVSNKNTPPAAPRQLGQGPIAQVIAERRAIIRNGCASIAALTRLEPELEQALSLALTPVATRQGVLGVLEVWHEQGEHEFDSRELRLLEALALQAAMVIENDRLHRTALESERFRQEVQIGSEIQQMLLLSQPPQDFPDLEVAALTIPSQRIDGDFYEFVKHHDRCLDVIVGDVMGKGIPAALLGAATKSQLLRTIGQLRSDAVAGKPAEPKEIVSAVAAAMTRQLIELESFVTLCYARVDLDRYQLDVVDCGHTQTIHFRHHLGTCALLRGHNLPLGVLEGEHYAQVSTPFEPGDVLLFYSDGVTEARDPAGNAFGEQALAEIVRMNGHLSPGRLIDAVRTAMTPFSDAETFADDLTCVAVKIVGPAKRAQMTRAELELSSDLAELARVRTFVYGLRTQLRDSAVSESWLNELVLAVDEAVSNIIIHAYHHQPGQRIRLVADVCQEWIAIRLYDWGEAFDPTRVEPPSFDGSREAGFGVYIMAHSVDTVHRWREVQGSNCIRLLKLVRDRR